MAEPIKQNGKKSKLFNKKAREDGHNTRGLGSPYNRDNILYHFSVFWNGNFKIMKNNIDLIGKK